MFIRDRFRNVLYTIGVVGILLALAPFYSGEAKISGRSMADHVELNPDEMPVKEELKLGWSRSPLVHYRYETTVSDDEGLYLKRQTRELRIGWASLSSMTLMIGLGFIWCGSLLRRKRVLIPAS